MVKLLGHMLATRFLSLESVFPGSHFQGSCSPSGVCSFGRRYVLDEQVITSQIGRNSFKTSLRAHTGAGGFVVLPVFKISQCVSDWLPSW